MHVRSSIFVAIASISVLGSVVVVGEAAAQSSVNYGRVTDVRQVDVENQGARTTGALVGGVLGATSGSSGRSGSNRALRGAATAAVGRQVGAAAGRSTAFEYTVLAGGGNTFRIVSEQSGLRVGDCVSVERGTYNNIRLAADDRCDATASGGTTAPPQQAVADANACATATQQVLDAETDEEFERAERRMRLLCN